MTDFAKIGQLIGELITDALEPKQGNDRLGDKQQEEMTPLERSLQLRNERLSIRCQMLARERDQANASLEAALAATGPASPLPDPPLLDQGPLAELHWKQEAEHLRALHDDAQNEIEKLTEIAKKRGKDLAAIDAVMPEARQEESSGKIFYLTAIRREKLGGPLLAVIRADDHEERMLTLHDYIENWKLVDG